MATTNVTDEDIKDLAGLACGHGLCRFTDVCTAALCGDESARADVEQILTRTRGYVPHVVVREIREYLARVS